MSGIEIIGRLGGFKPKAVTHPRILSINHHLGATASTKSIGCRSGTQNKSLVVLRYRQLDFCRTSSCVQSLPKFEEARLNELELESMRRLCTSMIVMGLSGPVFADDCKIVWWDLFLPQSEAEFEKTSEVSATLTLKDTGKLEPIRFELASSQVTGEDGTELDLLLGTQTLVLGGISNQVTVTLQPKTNSWLVGFDSKRIIRTTAGKTYANSVMLAGYLYCN